MLNLILLQATCKAGHDLGLKWSVEAGSTPLSLLEWQQSFDEAGVLLNHLEFRRAVFSRGVDHSCRHCAWSTLLVHDPTSSEAQRKLESEQQVREYLLMRNEWADDAIPYPEFPEFKHIIHIDVSRTDREMVSFATKDNANLAAMEAVLRTFAVYQPHIGYCQGMSDILAPLVLTMLGQRDGIEALAAAERSTLTADYSNPDTFNLSEGVEGGWTVEEEATVFWQLVAVMRRMGLNFDRHLKGTRADQTLVRVVLKHTDPLVHGVLRKKTLARLDFLMQGVHLRLKREAGHELTPRLWEALWAEPWGAHSHALLLAGLIRMHRRLILDPLTGEAEVLSLFQSLSGGNQLDVVDLLSEAEALANALATDSFAMTYHRDSSAQNSRDASVSDADDGAMGDGGAAWAKLGASIVNEEAESDWVAALSDSVKEGAASVAEAARTAQLRASNVVADMVAAVSPKVPEGAAEAQELPLASEQREDSTAEIAS